VEVFFDVKSKWTFVEVFILDTIVIIIYFNVISESCKTETGSAGGQPVRDSMMTNQNVNQGEDAFP
jgi:hypothetical protein